MKLKISFKQLKHTEALDERIKEKSEKFKKYFQARIDVQWVCWVHEENHWAEVKVFGPKFEFFAKASADNMYKSLDLVVEKIERQFEKQKDMYKKHKNKYQSHKYQSMFAQIRDEEEAYFEEFEDKSA